jgi:hypothetical protein
LLRGGDVRRLGNPAGAPALGLTPWRTWLRVDFIRKSRFETLGANARCILDTGAKTEARERAGALRFPGCAIGGKRTSSIIQQY